MRLATASRISACLGTVLVFRFPVDGVTATLAEELAAVCDKVSASFNRDGQWLPNDLMAFGFASGQVSVGMYDQLNGFPEAVSSLGLRALLDIAAG